MTNNQSNELREQAEARAKATEEELFELAQTVSEYDSL